MAKNAQMTADKILEAIETMLRPDDRATPATGRTILNLAEAYAWLTVPGVAHGGSAGDS